MFDMNQLLLFASSFTPIVTAVVQAIKTANIVPTRFLPLVALITGVVLGAGAQPLVNIDLVQCLWAGGLAGLSSVGLFELVSRARN